MLLASLATFLSMKLSLRRQYSANPQTTSVVRLMMYLAPAGIFVSGFFFPVPLGLLLYFVATNGWTLAQQHVLTKIVDRDPPG